MSATTVENAWCVGIRAKYIGPGNVRGSRCGFLTGLGSHPVALT